MTEHDPLDCSSVDPARDPERWARLVSATLARVDAVLAGRAVVAGPLEILGGWFRPILAAAAVLALLIGAADYAVGPCGSALDRASESRRLAALSDDAIGRGERPTGAQLLVAIRSRRMP
jgi:hypothetical protein